MSQSRLPQRLIAALALSATAVAVPLTAHAQDTALFAAYNAESQATVDDTPYGELIGALTIKERGRALVAYDVAHAQALPFFTQYVNYLANVPVEQLNRDEQLAYWLNTRNVLLIQGLAEERRVRGYKKKRGEPADPGAFWTEKRITVAGTPLSLQDIEQDILFAGWDDPNIMFGLYQGMKGGPPLPRVAFTGADVTAQLAEAGRRFNNDTRNFRVRRDIVRISSYYDWYLPLAFDGDEAALRQHLAGFAKSGEQELVRNTGKLDRKTLSTDFEQYRTRQNTGGGFGSGGARPAGGVGS